MIGIATRGYWGTTDLIGGPARAGAAATSTTTTWTAVRRQMIAALKGVTPASLSAAGYRVTRTQELDFRTHAEKNARAVLREYEITVLSDEISGAQNYQTEMRVATGEITIAYPNHWGIYATMDQTNVWNEAALRALAFEDRNLIDKAIGTRGSANYVAGQRSCMIGPAEFEEADGVTLLVLPFEVTYMHSSS